LTLDLEQRDDAYVTERSILRIAELILTAWGVGYKFADVD